MNHEAASNLWSNEPLIADTGYWLKHFLDPDLSPKS